LTASFIFIFIFENFQNLKTFGSSSSLILSAIKLSSSLWFLRNFKEAAVLIKEWQRTSGFLM